ncbi:MAG TPA: 3-phosphoglycerate dehydrogenase [Bacteroidales bacterium]|nr:3-phosphoglycerate dehydrogenase [Bacteroidales bacterium]HOL98783.1 3-phosphoglycerate dehydrogenase [Bacteroidales bacterium]HPD24531.1 3-phosphoglycerate dehydrogenase [Bacteroidales bacterium]HRT00218.1 3-phosphoglycerate dehydrogenase [Bacteroidales bacterium]HUM33185.1 3-phosphoglycerate dehydrogenase [Bacteroidales bacterium]
MKRVLLATEKPFAADAVIEIEKIAKSSGYELVRLENYKTKDELLNAVKDVDAIIIRSDIVDKEVIEAGKNLKIVVRAGAGYDNIDLNAATEHNVVAMNTPGQNSNAVAELAFGMMIYHARAFFSGKSGSELRGKTIGIHAYGNVGKYVGMIAKGFGMKIYAFDPFVDDALMHADGVIPVKSVEELYKNCQYVSLHIPANEKTKKSINKDLMMLMPKNAVLVNTARKEVISEVDLLEVMSQRKDFAYLSDIAPDCAAEMTEKFPGRFFFTPKKMGAQTEEANVNAGIAAIKQIIDFFEKGDVRFKVN